jgi:large subunit ribosomal protein L24
MSKVHVKKDDIVVLISGKGKEKEINKRKGRVLHVDKKSGRIMVEGLNMQTKHKKPRSAKDPGGRITQEGSIDASNVLIFCDKCDNPTRIGRKIIESGEKARYCKKCGEVFDIISKAE